MHGDSGAIRIDLWDFAFHESFGTSEAAEMDPVPDMVEVSKILPVDPVHTIHWPDSVRLLPLEIRSRN